MEIRVSVLGKVAYKQGASRDDKAKANYTHQERVCML